MNTIYKYQVDTTGDRVQRLPTGAEYLSIKEQRGKLFLWAKVDTEAPDMSIRLRVVGTGQSLPAEHNYWIHLDTVSMKNGLVWHIFQVPMDITVSTVCNFDYWKS